MRALAALIIALALSGCAILKGTGGSGTSATAHYAVAVELVGPPVDVPKITVATIPIPGAATDIAQGAELLARYFVKSQLLTHDFAGCTVSTTPPDMGPPIVVHATITCGPKVHETATVTLTPVS